MGLGMEMLKNSFLKSLERFLGLGLEIIENRFLESFWSDFWVWVLKSLKIASWKASGAIFEPGLGNV